MGSWRRVTVLAGALMAACGGGGDGQPPPDPNAVVFEFRIQGRGAEHAFRYATSSSAFIAKARAQLALPANQRRLFPAGPIASGHAGVNAPWGWHFKSAELVEATIELCDGNPQLVQNDLNYWLNVVKSFCPWGGYVHAERPT